MSIVGHFPEAEAAYRREQIIAAYRGRAASPRRYRFPWRRHTTVQVVPQRPLRAA